MSEVRHWIGIMPTKTLYHGVESVVELDAAGSDSLLTSCPVADAFNFEFPTDAHFVTYRPKDPDAAAAGWPRCNKPVLGDLRARGDDLEQDVFWFDFDNAHHQPWGTAASGQPEDLVQRIVTAAEHEPLFRQWAYFYVTEHGARLVFLADRPVPVGEAAHESEGVWRGILERLQAQGFADPLHGWFDSSTAPWNIPCRFPKVVRLKDKHNPLGPKFKSWESPSFALEHQPDTFFDPASIEGKAKSGKPNAHRAPKQTDFMRPDERRVEELLYRKDAKTGALKDSWWRKEAQRKIVGTEPYPYIFEERDLNKESGERDAKLVRLAAKTVERLFPVGERGLPGTTPEHVYALLWDKIGSRLDAYAGPEQADDKIERHVTNYWGQQLAEAEARGEELRARKNDASSIMNQILEGMQTWCPAPELRDESEEKRLRFVRSKLIACVKSSHYIMTPSGYYDPVPVGAPYLCARIRELGMDLLLPIETARGSQIVPTLPSELISRHGTVVTSVSGEPQIPGAWIRGLGGKDATMVLPMYSRDPMIEETAAFSPDVDEFLMHFSGAVVYDEDGKNPRPCQDANRQDSRYDRLIEWLSWCLAFDEGPECALSLSGAPTSGKGMLLQGLKECIDTGKLATGSDLVAQHGTGLMESPFLSVSEGFPVLKGAHHPADSFRRVVAGEIEPINPKFGALIHIRNPVRVIITANNLDTVSVLSGGRNLSAHDREALAVRLLHIEIPDTCSTWLESKGGKDGRGFTAKPGAMWCAKDNQPSNYILARHIMYLYKTRGARKGKRFLVDGDPPHQSCVMDELRLAGNAIGVAEVIIDMINATQSGARRQFDGLSIEPVTDMERAKHGARTYWVLTSAVVEYARTLQTHKVDLREIKGALKALRIGEPHRRVLPSRPKVGTQSWNELDVDMLYRVALNTLGKPCEGVRQLVEGGSIISFGDAAKPPVEMQKPPQRPAWVKSATNWKKT